MQGETITIFDPAPGERHSALVDRRDYGGVVILGVSMPQCLNASMPSEVRYLETPLGVARLPDKEHLLPNA